MNLGVYDRQGRPITMEQWGSMRDQRRVAETTLPNGKWVSTVWLGLDHGWGGHPLIFETMVFPSKDGPLIEEDADRYSTEAEALAGHEAMVKKWSAT